MVLSPLDAWVLDRLLFDRQPPPNGEMASVSEANRPLIERLAAMHPVDRQPLWHGFLFGQADRDQIIKAIADVDPMKPAPPASAPPSSHGWPPLRLDALPRVEPFPVDVLPDAAARLVTEGADAIGCPRDFVGLAVLVIIAGTIGRSVSLLLKSGYFAVSAIFGGCVGPPSDGKTPALKAAAAAVRAIDDTLADKFARDMEQWNDEVSKLKKGDKPPLQPKLQRIDVDDVTTEMLPVLLSENPRGLLMTRDELTALVLGMNQYKSGKGNDRAVTLKIWSGDRIVKDRVGHENREPIRCPHPCLSIIGGLPPDMLGDMADAKGRADGFIDRFLLVYPDPVPVAGWSERGIPGDVAKDWRDLVARIWMRSLDIKDGKYVPHAMFFSPAGKAQWEKRFNAHADEMNDEAFPPSLRGAWGKLREYAGRLTLVLTLMYHAADPTADPLDVPSVGPRQVDDAWKLIDYFKNHTRRVYAVISRGPVTGEARAAKAIVDWVRSGRLSVFTEHQFKQARRWVKDEDLTAALSYLTGRHAIRIRQAPKNSPKGGRPSSPSYEVNPALFGARNP
jgi:hypothetical protein